MKFTVVMLASLIALKASFPSFEGTDLLKLPSLYSHFEEHKKGDPTLGFLDFLWLHYEGNSHHAEDHDNHHKLPFSSHTLKLMSVVSMVHSPEWKPMLGAVLLDGEKGTYMLRLTSIDKDTPWLPPKIG